MNIFEDLIEELKEENLLEETVIETNNALGENTYNQPFINNTSSQTSQPDTFQNQATSPETTRQTSFSEDLSESEADSVKKLFEEFSDLDGFQDGFHTETAKTDFIEQPAEAIAFKATPISSESIETNEINQQYVQNLFQQNDSMMETILREEEGLLNSEESLPEEDESVDFRVMLNSANPLLSKEVPDDNEFFRRRATEEVNSLQIVEHIISAIEREKLKMIPKQYDDLSVSMALHDFLKVTENPHSLEHAQAEFKLMQETESWYSALSQRDKSISVSDLRKYCENTRPALSSQALISLARFYRNSPFSEVVRSKFDMVITRLLTKERWDDTRDLIFTRDDLTKQIGNLYADWSSIPLYESNEDDSDVLIGVLKFEDFANEANGATNFDELIKNDFFNRLKIYKESTGEKFFAPLLAATVIESNVVIGNKYVELIQQERERNNGKLLEEKYNFLLDQSVSDATSKTLQLVEVLKVKKEKAKPEAEFVPEIKEVVVLESSKKEKSLKQKPQSGQSKLPVSKPVIVFAVLAFLMLGVVYFWVESNSPEMKTSPSVIKVDLESTSLKEYFKTARISKGTLFAVTQTSWDQLSEDVKLDVLKKTLTTGSEQGYDKVHVLNGEGKTIAFASNQGITLDPR